MRESGTPLSICEVERVRRVEAMDELKRVIDVADDLPYARLILHMGGPRETADPRKRDAAFSTLEASDSARASCGRHDLRGEHHERNGDPSYLRALVDETRLSGLRFNFDIGHANLSDFAEGERLEKSFSPLRDLSLPPTSTITTRERRARSSLRRNYRLPAAIKNPPVCPAN